MDYKKGSIIARAGNPTPIVGILFAGRASVRQVNASTGQAAVLDTVNVGDHFGEVGTLLGRAQSYEYYAEDDCTVLVISKEIVGQLSEKIAPFSYALAQKLSNRMVRLSMTALRGAPAAAAAAPAPAAAPAAEADAGVIPFVKVAAFDPDQKLLELIPARFMQQRRLLPLELRGSVLTVGMVDPYNQAAVGELRRVLHSADPKIVAISQDDFNETVVRLKVGGSSGSSDKSNQKTDPNTLQFDQLDAEREADKAVRVIGDEVVQLANRIISTGLDLGASDIHIELAHSGMRVRYRVSGTLIDWDQYIAASFAKGLVARFKILSGLDITERRLPQDGRIGIKIGRRELDLRVSTLPASRGEKIVLRLFEAANMMRPLEQVFIDPQTLAVVRKVLNRPFGAIIVAGPTGAGKSSTLYAALNERRKTRPDTNIIMVEDPIEYRLQGVTQVQVNHAIDLDFAGVLRAMLRQDPDVIMVGEVRDSETAQLALEAAMTGHLLFTSLHANTALAVIQRLENFGCNRTMIAQSVALVMVQRLARRLCPKCATTEVPPPVLLKSLAMRGLIEAAAPVPLPRGVGCAECNHTGYAGRVAVLETLHMSDELRTGLMVDQPLNEIEETALKTNHLISFQRYASFLMTRNIIGPSEALLTVA